MKLNKPYTNRQYAALAAYGNANNQHIEDKGEYLETVDNAPPTMEDMQRAMRLVRNQYLSETDKIMLADFPITEDEQEQYKIYRGYLRDYTKTDKWYLQKPMTFNEWMVNNKPEKVDELQK